MPTSIHFALFLLHLPNLAFPAAADFFPRRVYAYQREVVRPDPAPTTASAPVAVNSGSGNQQIICVNGSVRNGLCECEWEHFGKHCERRMFCRGFERAENGSCPKCKDNYIGEFCQHPDCQNGGLEAEHEQVCQCPQPYSGTFCEELKMEDIYRYYNTRAALIGPLGILTVIPMFLCFYMCEKKARHRQVDRIQKSWTEQYPGAMLINGKRIESLLAEKV